MLEAPTEGAWAPTAEEFYFGDYQQRGFELVRVPVRWDEHTATSPPYSIDATFLARVQTVVGWGLSRNLSVIVNTHHDDWIDDNATYAALKPRFVAIWTQIAAAFADAPALLRFEVINEPVKLHIEQLNDMYATVVPIIRETHPVRPIYLGGLQWMSPSWIASNPDAIAWPALANGGEDPNLRLEVHSYDPFKFCMESPPSASTWGSASDIAAVLSMYEGLAAWSAAHGNRRVLMGEAGCQVGAPSRPDRLLWYATVAAAANASVMDGLSLWDDYGTWKVYSRDSSTHAFDEGVMQAVGL